MTAPRSICPGCGAQLPWPVARCPQCAIDLTGDAVGRLSEVNALLRPLLAEREQLLRTLHGSQPAGPEPQVARPHSSPGPYSGQQLLLGVGALLVVVAALVFVAVAWRAIGVGGQVLLLVTVTVGVAAGADRAARRRLPQTAEALGWISGALFVIDASAARSLGLVAPDVDAASYAAVVAAVGTLMFASGAKVSGRVVAFGLLAVLFAQVPALAVVTALEAPEVVAGAVLLTQAWADAVSTRVLGGRLRQAAALAGFLTLGAATVIALIISADPSGSARWAGVVLGLACAATAGAWAGIRDDLLPLAILGGAVAGIEVAFGAELAAGRGSGASLGVVAAGAGAGAYVWWRRVPGRPLPLWVLAAGASAYAAALLGLAVHDQEGGIVVAVGALALAGSAVSASGRVEAYPAAALAWWATLATALDWGEVAVGPFALVLALGTGGLATAAWLAPRHDLEAATLAGAAVSCYIAIDVATGARPAYLAGVLAVCGLAALVYSLRTGRELLALVGVPLVSAAVWVLLDDAEIGLVEAYSLPLAALCLLVGMVRLRRHPGASSWVTWGPVVTAALVPSTAVAMSEAGLVRPVLVLVAGTATLIFGVHHRWQAPVVTAALCVAGTALSQLGPYAAAVPRWLSLGVLGTVLLVAGATYEARLRDVRRASAWMSSLT